MQRMFKKTIVQSYRSNLKMKPYANMRGKYIINRGKHSNIKKEARDNANRALKKAFRNKLKKDLFNQLLEL